MRLHSRLAGLVVVFLCLSSGLGVKAQSTPQFSQYNSMPLLLGPSFAGNSLGSRFFANFRDQWSKIPGAYMTYSAAIDNNFYSINSGVGLLLMRDIMGSAKLGNTSITGLYSYRFNITDDWRIRPGVSFSFAQKALNYQKAVFPDQISETGIDPSTLEVANAPYNYFDAAGSVIFYNRRMWFGLTADHLLRPVHSFARLDSRIPILWSQYGGINFNMPTRVGKAKEMVSLTYLLRMQGKNQQIDVTANWYHAPLMLGFGFRGIPAVGQYPTYDALVFMVGLGFGGLSVGYSYDFTVSKLGNLSGGSHEITLSFSFNEGEKRNARGSVPCPDVVRYRMFGDKESFR